MATKSYYNADGTLRQVVTTSSTGVLVQSLTYQYVNG